MTAQIVNLQSSADLPQGTDVTSGTNLLLPPVRAGSRLAHFAEEVYDLSAESHLVRFVKVLLGDAGVGQARKRLLMARLQQTLQGTHFYDLDKFYGGLFGVRRSQEEVLDLDPYTGTATSETWTQQQVKDTSYRSRVGQFARALQYGATPTGMELVAEALLTVDCEVYEAYIQADAGYQTYAEIEKNYPTYNSLEGVPYSVLEGQGLARVSGDDRREFVVRPKRQITQGEAYDLTKVLSRLKPADARFTIDTTGIDAFDPVTIRGALADSNYWEITPRVAPRTGLLNNPYQVQSATPVEQPRPPFSAYQGEAWSYIGDVVGVSAYSSVDSASLFTDLGNGSFSTTDQDTGSGTFTPQVIDDGDGTFEPMQSPTVVSVMPTQRITLPDGGYLDYDVHNGLMPRRQTLAGRTVSDGVLTAHPYWSQSAATSPDLAPLYSDRVPVGGLADMLANSPIIDALSANPDQRFWATPSRVKTDPTREIMELRFTTERRLNHLSLAVAHYPHDLLIETFNVSSNAWQPLLTRSVYDSVPQYLPPQRVVVGHPQHSQPNHWLPLDLSFEPVVTSRLRLTLTRNAGSAPQESIGNEIAYSLGVRNLEPGYRIYSLDDVPAALTSGQVIGSTTDPLGSAVDYVLRQEKASDVLTPGMIWRSDPQPVNYAVVNFYLDVRTNDVPASALDVVSNGDTWTVSSRGSSVIDQTDGLFTVVGTGTGVVDNLDGSFTTTSTIGSGLFFDQGSSPASAYPAPVPLPQPTPTNDNSDGTFSSTGDFFTDNGDGTFSSQVATDDGDGTFMSDSIVIPILPGSMSVVDNGNGTAAISSPDSTVNDNQDGTFLSDGVEANGLVTLTTEVPDASATASQTVTDNNDGSFLAASVDNTVSDNGNGTFSSDGTSTSDGTLLLASESTSGPSDFFDVDGIDEGHGMFLVDGVDEGNDVFALSALTQDAGLFDVLGGVDEGDGLYLVGGFDEGDGTYLYSDAGVPTYDPMTMLDSQVIERFYLEPTHTGAHMTIYWSDQGTSEMDPDQDFYESLIWNPIPRDYTLQKGYVHIPPTRARFFKFEFTSLNAEPFEAFLPLVRKVRLFPPALINSLTTGSVTDAVYPAGLQSTMETNSVNTRYADALDLLQRSTDTQGYSATEALYSAVPALQADTSSAWVYNFQPWHQGDTAPRFLHPQVHTYDTIEVRHTTKVGFFVGLNEVRAYSLNNQADDDTQVYLETFHDFRQIQPGLTWTFNSNSMTTELSNNAVATSKVYSSLHNVRAVQFATQQSDPEQLVPDDDFRDPALATSDFSSDSAWHKVGDAILLYSAADHSMVLLRYAQPLLRPALRESHGLVQPVVSKAFSYRSRPFVDSGATAALYGGIESPLLGVSNRGRGYAAVRMTFINSVTDKSPMRLQVVKGYQTDHVLAELLLTGNAGETIEKVLTVDLAQAAQDPIRVRLVQDGASDNQIKIDTLSFFDEGILWEFSVNGGTDWIPAIGVRNNANAVITFPEPGNQLVWRATGLRQRMAINALKIRPQYEGLHNARDMGVQRGPNISVYDADVPVQEDPMFTDWTKPVPRWWYSAYKRFPKLPVDGAPLVSEFSRFYGRPVADSVAGAHDSVAQARIIGRVGTDWTGGSPLTINFAQPISHSLVSRPIRLVGTWLNPALYPMRPERATTNGSQYRRTPTDLLPAPTDSAVWFKVAPNPARLVNRIVHPI